MNPVETMKRSAVENRIGRYAMLLIFAAAMTAGCHKNTNTVNPASLGPVTSAPPPAPTATLAADPLAINLGQSVVLNWRTTDASVVSIDGIGKVNLNGTQTVSPSSSTNFHLVATGDGGTVEANVRVTVRVPEAPVAPAYVPPTSPVDTDAAAEAAFHANVADIYFDYDSDTLRPDGVSAASKAAAYLVAHPEVRIVIGGYCDDRGSAEYNLALGENRAAAAKTALVNSGVAGSRIRVVSFGKEKQFCTDETEACWQQNRRAQFSLDK